jgi:hypothetical protein
MPRRVFLVRGWIPAWIRREAALRAGDHVTDGSRLLRVVSPLTPREPDGLLELEDRRTLERLLYTGREAWHLWLRRVSDELPDERWLLHAGATRDRVPA